MNQMMADKIKGALIGAVAGTELGFQCAMLGKEEPLTWRVAPEPTPYRVDVLALTPWMASLVTTYAKIGGRVMPEDWATAILADQNVTENQAFWQIELKSMIELLKEGMNPRITGLNGMPSGNMAAIVTMVGIYHAGDVENAYLDGLELASMSQKTPCAEWGAMSAAAVAAALAPGATAERVIEQVLAVSHSHMSSKQSHYRAYELVGRARGKGQKWPEQYDALLNADLNPWHGDNPIGWALAHIAAMPDDLTGCITLSATQRFGIIYAGVTGAIAGALAGAEQLPQSWKQGCEPLMTPFLPMLDVVENKWAAERKQIIEIEQLSARKTAVEGVQRSVLFDKIYGCLLAGAYGNAMGSVVEGRFWYEVDEKYPGGITRLMDPTRLENEDDNQMAMLLAETYIRRNGLPVTARDFGETWKQSYHYYKFWIDERHICDSIISGMDARITGHWNAVTGSTVMCMEPVGLYHLGNPKNAYVDAMGIGYMYQRGLDVITAAILAASTAEAMRPEATVDSILAAALAAAPKEKMTTFDHRKVDNAYDYISLCLDVAGKYDDVMAARKELTDKCLYYHMIDPLELLGLAYAVFKIANGDIRQSAIGGTNIGRDSDTISGRAAMLSGTLRGGSAMPKDWLAEIDAKALGRIQKNSERIEDLIVGKRLPLLRQIAQGG